MLTISGVNCINTTSGYVTLCRWSSGLQVGKELPDLQTGRPATQSDITRRCIDTIDSTYDEHKVARNMYRIEINIYIYKRNCASIWLFITITEVLFYLAGS